MKNKDAIEEAIEVLQIYVDGKETSLTKIAARDAIKGLRQAQEKPASIDVSAINEALGALNEFKKSEDWQEGTFSPEYRNGNWHDDLNNYITPNIMATIRKALEAHEKPSVGDAKDALKMVIDAIGNAKLEIILSCGSQPDTDQCKQVLKNFETIKTALEHFAGGE